MYALAQVSKLCGLLNPGILLSSFDETASSHPPAMDQHTGRRKPRTLSYDLGTLLRKAKQSNPNEKPQSTVVGEPNLRRVLFRVASLAVATFVIELFKSLCTRLQAKKKQM